MKKEDFINQTLISKSGERLKIVSAEGDNLEDLIIQTDNKKMYKLLTAYQSGFLRFEDNSINQLLQKHLQEKEEKKQRILKQEEKFLASLAEQSRLEEERLRDAIDSFRGEYAFLSNFYDCSISYNGHVYRNNEAAFQAQKDLSRSAEFTLLNPTMAKRLGRKVSLRSDWERVKLGIMEEIVRCKFTQHPELKVKLLATGERLLIEGNTWNDTFWGVCKGKGKNNLGKILMKIRKELQG